MNMFHLNWKEMKCVMLGECVMHVERESETEEKETSSVLQRGRRRVGRMEDFS